jgi:hypothetical protein
VPRGTAGAQAGLDGRGAVFSLQECEQGRGVEDVHAASSAIACRRRSASSSPTRSKPERSSRTSDFSCSRLTRSTPPGVAMSTIGVPSVSPVWARSSAGMTSRPRSPNPLTVEPCGRDAVQAIVSAVEDVEAAEMRATGMAEDRAAARRDRPSREGDLAPRRCPLPGCVQL